MQRGRVLNFSKYRLLEFLKANIHLLICFLFLSLGAIIGLIIFDDFKIVTSFLEQFFKDYITARETGRFLKITLLSFFESLLVFMLLFMSGTSLFGVVTVPLTILGCGAFYGSAVAYLYFEFALKGVAFNAVIFLPSSIVLLLFLVFAARLSFCYSIELARLTMPNSMHGDLFLQFKDYSIKFLLLSLSSISAALIDGLTATSMLRFFEF